MKHVFRIIFAVLLELSVCTLGLKMQQGSLLGIGCYNSKQLRDVRLINISSSRINVTLPLRNVTNSPEWCTGEKFLVPQSLQGQAPQATNSPFALSVNSFTQAEAFRVRLKSLRDVTFVEAILVAKPVMSRRGIKSENIGRFLLTDNSELICCSQSDKDVVRFRNYTGVKETFFNWVPYEEVANDFEGDFLFQATVVKSEMEYWTNITSNTMNFVSRFW